MLPRLIISALIACAAPRLLPAQAAPSPRMDEVRALLQQGRTADALAVLRVAAEAAPGDAAVRNALGAVLNREGYYPEALTHAEAAVRIEPDNPRFRYNRGIVRAEHGRFEDALEDFDHAVARTPGVAAMYLERAAALLSLGRLSDARADWATARRTDSTLAWVDWYEGIGLIVLGDFAAAASRIDRLVRAEPSFGAGPLWLWLVRRRAGLAAQLPVTDGDDWPAPLIRHLRGELTEEALMAHARNERRSGDQRREGEALFFIAEQRLLAGERDVAAAYLRRALAVRAPHHAWRGAAQEELGRIAR